MPVLFALGYPVAVVVLARFVPVVRERRRGWFAAHQGAVSAITAGWVLRERWPAAAVNAAWLAVASAWWVVGGRRRATAGEG